MAKKGYRTVATFPSKSRLGTYYVVKMDEEGKLSCSCPSWIFKKGAVRDCPHIRIVRTEVLPNAYYIIDKLGRKRLIRGKRKKNPEGLKGWKLWYESCSSKKHAELVALSYKKSGFSKVRITPTTKYSIKLWLVSGYAPPTYKENPEGLYEAFHGNPPARIRKVFYEPPKKNEPLIKIGRLVRIEYQPEAPSKRKNIRFYHEMGDTGSNILKSNVILATDKKGGNLYILRDKKSKRPFFSSRGIVG